jgi:hypothetical protein
VKEGIPIAIGSEASANILKKDDVAAGCSALGKFNVITPRGATVRSALEEDGKFAVGVRTKDVAAEGDAIAHFDRNAALNPNGVEIVGERKRGEELEDEQEREKGENETL